MGFVISYPKEWRVIEYPQAVGFHSFSDSQAGLTVQLNSLGGLDLEAWVDSFTKSMVRKYIGLQVLGRSTGHAGTTLPFISVGATVPHNSEQHHMTFNFYQADGVVFTIIVTAQEQWYPRLKPTFDAAIESFSVDVEKAKLALNE